MQHTTLTVIIPVYNGGYYLETLIDSIFEVNQGFSEFLEIIVIDDGSTDDSYKKILELSKKTYTNIKIFSKQNGGIASARTFGLQHASSEFVTFCDQDDKVVSSYKKFVELLQISRADFIISNYYENHCNQQILNNKIKQNEIYEGKKCLRLASKLLGGSLLESDKLIQDVPSTVWNCIYRKSFIDANNLKFVKIMSYEDDWHFILDSLCCAKKVLLNKDAYYEWFINDKSESHTHHYRENYVTKRLRLLQVVADLLNKMPYLSKEQILEFKDVLQKRSLLWGHWNALLRPYSEYFVEIKNIRATFRPKLSWCTLRSLNETISIICLYCKMYKIAYLFNTKVIKRYYQ